MSATAYEGWALVEQMGFRQTVAMVSEVEQYGTRMLRLDVPVGGTLDGNFTTRFAGGPSLYQVTPLSEEVARREVERMADPRPVAPLTHRLDGGRGDSEDLDDADEDHSF